MQDVSSLPIKPLIIKHFSHHCLERAKMSNSKLNSAQKMLRKNMLVKVTGKGGEIFSFPECRATVAIVPVFTGSKMSRVSISFCSADETKFRRKVGEYHALNKLFDGECIYVPTPNQAEYFANEFAKLISDYSAA